MLRDESRCTVWLADMVVWLKSAVAPVPLAMFPPDQFNELDHAPVESVQAPLVWANSGAPLATRAKGMAKGIAVASQRRNCVGRFRPPAPQRAVEPSLTE